MAKHVPPQRVIDKIMSRIEVTDSGCWVFTGALAGGYGHVAWSLGHRKMVDGRTHRIIYESLRGPIPEGMDLDHLCHNPDLCQPKVANDCPHRACCNPDHLQPVTRRVNLLRGGTIPAKRARTTECPKGHPYTADNTIVDKLNRRQCKTCTYARRRDYYQRTIDARRAYNRMYHAQRRAQRLEADKD